MPAFRRPISDAMNCYPNRSSSASRGSFLELNTGTCGRAHFRAWTSSSARARTVDRVLHPRRHGQRLHRHTADHVITAGSLGLFTRMNSLLSPGSHRRSEEGPRAFIPIDAPVDLPYGHPVAELGPGELFGEMTCMNYYPRSATVRAARTARCSKCCATCSTSCSATNASALTRSQTTVARAGHAPAHRANARVNDDGDRQTAAQPRGIGTVRARPDHLPPGRRNRRLLPRPPRFVKVSQRTGGELVLAYCARTMYFGEIGLLGGGLRTATCTALDHVELVRIAPPISAPCSIGSPTCGDARGASGENSRRPIGANVSNCGRSDQFLEQGLMEAQNLLVLDLESAPDATVHQGVRRTPRASPG